MTPDVALPGLIGTVYRHVQFDVVEFSHCSRVIVEQQFGGILRAVEDDQATELVALVEHLVDQGARRGQPQAAGRDRDIFAAKVSIGKPRPNGPRMPIVAPACRV